MKNYTWDQCSKKIDAFVKELIKDGHSGQDLVFMGGRMMHFGIYAENRNADEYIKANPWEES